MKCLSKVLLNLTKKLNDKCLQKLEDIDEETKKRNNKEYIVMRNYIQKENFYTKDLAKATNLPQIIVREMLQSLGFVSFKNRINSKYLDWIREFIKDFLIFFNYPLKGELNRHIENVNSFMKQSNQPKNYKIILLNALESEELLLFPQEITNDMMVIVKNASWGLIMYYFKELYESYINTFPELNYQKGKSVDVELNEPDDSVIEETFEEDAEEIESVSSLEIKTLIEQNQKLKIELNESRAVCDFLSMQYDDLKVSMENQKKISSEQNYFNVFRAFNSIENNKALDAFFIAKSTLDKLKSSGWVSSRIELKSILYIFDLFDNFFKKQNLTSKFKLGEVITITSDNVSNFEYNGQELKKGMEIFARVRSPAWYYKGSLITKASVIEIKGGENK